MTVVTALDVAGYMVELAAQTDENDLTNLKLQKLLYFAQMEHLRKTGRLLFSDEIEAWQYGPVVPRVYEAFRACGAFPITVFDVTTSTADLPGDLKAFVQEMWSKHGIYSASHLVSLTHRPGSPWRRYYNASNGSKIIPKEELQRPDVERA